MDTRELRANFADVVLTRNRASLIWRYEVERRSRKLGPVTLAFCAVLSGCGARLESNRPAQMGVSADISDDGATVRAADVRAIRGPLDAMSDRPCPFGIAVSEGPLRRDAFGRARIVGHVVRGEALTVLDFIDRRLRVLRRVVFDGGHWRKVRGQNGDVGWLPAAEVQGIGGPCEDLALSGQRRAPEPPE